MGSMGSGKSTFTAELLRRLGAELGPLTELEEGRNARGSRIRLRGHLAGDLVYLGKMRERHPGQDGLDRASPSLVRPWLARGPGVSMIVTEGEMFATRDCMGAFAEYTDLLVIHLYAEEWLLDLRFIQRGTNQSWSAVRRTVTRAENALAMHTEREGAHRRVDSGAPSEWDSAIEAVLDHLQG